MGQHNHHRLLERSGDVAEFVGLLDVTVLVGRDGHFVRALNPVYIRAERSCKDWVINEIVDVHAVALSTLTHLANNLFIL